MPRPRSSLLHRGITLVLPRLLGEVLRGYEKVFRKTPHEEVVDHVLEEVGSSSRSKFV